MYSIDEVNWRVFICVCVGSLVYNDLHSHSSLEESPKAPKGTLSLSLSLSWWTNTDLFTQARAIDGRAVTVTRTVRVRTPAKREREREVRRAAVSKVCATVRTEQDEEGDQTPGLLLSVRALHTFQRIPDHKTHHCILCRRVKNTN